MEEKGNAGHVLFLHFEAFHFYSAKLSISFLPSNPICLCQFTSWTAWKWPHEGMTPLNFDSTIKMSVIILCIVIWILLLGSLYSRLHLCMKYWVSSVSDSKSIVSGSSSTFRLANFSTCRSTRHTWYVKYTIWSIICEASCHPVLSPSHVVIWSIGHSVTRSLGRLVTRSLGHSVTQSLHPVILSSILTSIFFDMCDGRTDNIRGYRSASQTNMRYQFYKRFKKFYQCCN